jgi:CDP-diacylglycerol--glycerol-3-phosphate 3-phosphatidyltransferase
MAPFRTRFSTFNLPIGLTLFRLTMVPVFIALLVHPQITACRWAAVALFAGMAATDKLDGYLARRWNQVTRLGSLLDPAADKLLVTAAVGLLACHRFAPDGWTIPWPLVVGIYLKDVGVLLGIAVVARMLGCVRLKARLPGKWSTTVQLALVMATLLTPDWVALSWQFAAVLMWSLWYLTLAATAAAGIAYAREGARQLRAAARAEETEPSDSTAGSAGPPGYSITGRGSPVPPTSSTSNPARSTRGLPHLALALWVSSAMGRPTDRKTCDRETPEQSHAPVSGCQRAAHGRFSRMKRVSDRTKPAYFGRTLRARLCTPFTRGNAAVTRGKAWQFFSCHPGSGDADLEFFRAGRAADDRRRHLRPFALSPGSRRF